MIIKFKTESGAEYTLNEEVGTWIRGGDTKYNIRTTDGVMTSHSNVKIGEPVEILGPPLTEGTDIRLITTTPVAEISESVAL
jgi:hypothetical protein